VPFTPSHAVVAIPFARTRMVPAAVAVGAMTPDLPIFVPGMIPGYGATHDLAWVPVTTVLAFVLLLVWRSALRPAVRELAPRAIAARLPSDWDVAAVDAARRTVAGGLGAVGGLALSLALGVVSHIAWDLFTHEGRTGTRLFPLLDAQWGPFTGVKWLQHGSSLFGLVVLAVWGVLWLSRRTSVPVVRLWPGAVRVVWWVSLPAALVLSAMIAAVVAGGFGPEFTVTHLVYGVLTRVAAAWAVATMVLAVSVQIARRRRTAGAPSLG